MNEIFAFIRRYFIPIAILLLIIWTVGFFEAGRYAVYSAHPELSGQEQASAILQKVGALIQLPSGETPTMATINDAASAKKAQPFLANALNGDVLIVYPNAQTAILYRPSTNKLIAVGPVTNESNSVSQGSTPIPATTSSKSATTTANVTTTSSKSK